MGTCRYWRTHSCLESEATCDDLQVLYTPVAGIPSHSRKDFLGVGHDSMVSNTAPVNNTGWLTGARDGFSANSMRVLARRDVGREVGSLETCVLRTSEFTLP